MKIQTVLCMVMIIICVLSSIAGAVRTGDLIIETTPNGAKVILDDTVAGFTPVTIRDYEYGNYDLIIQKAGYTKISEVVTINKPSTTLSYQMTPETGVLRISSIPTGATISIDGNKKSETTPVTFLLQPGSHWVKIEKNDYSEYREEFSIDAGEEVTIEAVLEGAWGEAITNNDGTVTVGISSRPTGASIWIDGDQLDTKTPAIVTLRPGDHQVRISKTGYEAYEEEIKFPDESPLVIRLDPLTSGTLKIESTPENAEVTLDGEIQGKTPLTLNDVGYGDHQIRIRKAGYGTVEETITVEHPSRLLTYDLSAQKGIVRLNTFPEGAVVLVDNTLVNEKTPVTLQLSPGTHYLAVAKEFYSTEAIYKTVTLEAGEEITVDLVLPGPGGQYVSNQDGTILVGITTEPEGATVRLDGLRHNTPTPGTYRTTTGEHQIKIELAGYQEYSEEIMFPDESPLIITLIPLATDFPDPSAGTQEEEDSGIDPGKLTITSNPPGADVYRSNQKVGTTPMSRNVKPGVEFTITIIKDGYQPYNESVTISSGEKKRISADLIST